MIALIREVAADGKNISRCGFLRGANVKKTLATSHCTRMSSGSRPDSGVQVRASKRDTPDNVYSHHLSYYVRKYE